MFNKKPILDTHDSDFIRRDEVVYCDECKCLLKAEDAQPVKNYGPIIIWKSHYCQKCKKPYSKVYYSDLPSIKYYGEVEMTQDGKPIIKK